MKPASRLPGRQHPQIWNSAAQLADIPIISTQTLIPAGARAVILAPHPGDEVGACGGLLQLLSNLDQPMLLISVTDGALAHPGSPLWNDERLRTHRPHPQESVDALHRLGIAAHGLQWVRGGFPEKTWPNTKPSWPLLSPVTCDPVTWCSAPGARMATATTTPSDAPGRWPPTGSGWRSTSSRCGPGTGRSANKIKSPGTGPANCASTSGPPPANVTPCTPTSANSPANRRAASPLVAQGHP